MSGATRLNSILPRFSIDRRITILMIMASALVVGVIASFGIPLELVPRGFESPSLTVVAPWRDAPAREVLDKVVLPLEEELSTVGGLDTLNSFARYSVGEVHLNFKPGTDMDVAYREVRDRILRVKPQMPGDIEQVVIQKVDENDIPVMVVGVALDPSVSDVYNVIQREIIQPLSRVEGVASVSSQGLMEKEVVIELDRDKTAQAGLNIYEVGRLLASDNFSMSSGAVRQGSRKLLLRSIAWFDSLEALGDRRLSPTVRLRDVAEVSYTVPEQDWSVRVNGKPAYALQVLKEGQANTIEVGERLREAYQRVRENPRLRGSDMAILFDQSGVILESLSTLRDSGLIGAVLAVVVLLFFLRRFRMTLIITLAIPLSMLMALTVMYFAGETLNILTLLGLIIAVGLLVDNSVVVAENIQRMYDEGASRRDACIAGAGELALAIVLATLTTVIVFLPVSLVEGQIQFFLLRFSVPVAVSLIASLFVALLFLPISVYLTLGRKGRKESRVVRGVHHWMDRILGGVYRITLDPISRAYRRVLAAFLGRRLDLVLIVFTVWGVTLAWPWKSIEVVDVSREDRRNFRIRVELPPTNSLEDSAKFFGRVEGVLSELKPEIGMEGYMIVHGPNWGRIEGWFPNTSQMSRREATRAALDRLPKLAGVKYFAGTDDQLKEEEDKFLFKVILTGENPEELDEVAEGLKQRMVGIEGVLGVRGDTELAPNELELLVDRTRAQRQQIDPRVIAGVVGYSLRGQTLPRFREDGKEIPVRLRFREEDRESLSELADFAVPTATGTAVQLSSVTDVQFKTAARGIFRREKRISQRVTVELDEGMEQATRRRLQTMLDDFALPEGVRLGAEFERKGLEDDFEAMKFAMRVSILFIYLLMGFLFESFILPLSIILTIPLAGIGVIWVHFLTGRDLDFLGAVGVILLIGVVVNNGIVLIDYVTRLRADGHERTSAILLAAERRFRPIMMTAGTTIFGMIPLTLGEPTSIGLSYRSFGLALIGGMVTATALTLFVVPIFYTLFDDARLATARALRWALRR